MGRSPGATWALSFERKGQWPDLICPGWLATLPVGLQRRHSSGLKNFSSVSTLDLVTPLPHSSSFNAQRICSLSIGISSSMPRLTNTVYLQSQVTPESEAWGWGC